MIDLKRKTNHESQITHSQQCSIERFDTFACSTSPQGPGWISLVDGDKGLENWNKLGDANWRAENNAIVADKGAGGFLVSKNSYKDFVIYAEFGLPPIPIAVFSFVRQMLKSHG